MREPSFARGEGGTSKSELGEGLVFPFWIRPRTWFGLGLRPQNSRGWFPRHRRGSVQEAGSPRDSIQRLTGFHGPCGSKKNPPQLNIGELETKLPGRAGIRSRACN